MEEKICPDGRYVVFKFKVNDITYKVAGCYGPNQDDPTHITGVMNTLNEMEGENTIIMGDFNLVMDIQLDKHGGNPTTNMKCRNALKDWMEETDMCDVWRIKHPNDRTFTWKSNHKPPIMCRLDFFVVSAGVVNRTEICEIGPGICSDHSYVKLCLGLDSPRRGRGFWKFNKSLLEYDSFKPFMIEAIKHAIQDNENSDPKLLWETVKSCIRGACISFGSRMRKMEKVTINTLEGEITKLKESLPPLGGTSPVSNIPIEVEKIEKLIEIKAEELRELVDKQCREASMRSQTLGYELGDRPSKYFLNLERSRSVNKTITKLVNDHGSTIEDQAEILKEQSRFYQNLYTSSLSSLAEHVEDRGKLMEELDQLEKPQVDPSTYESLTKNVSEDEIWGIVKNSCANKSPGTDGLTTEFYIDFGQTSKKLY